MQLNLAEDPVKRQMETAKTIDEPCWRCGNFTMIRDAYCKKCGAVEKLKPSESPTDNN